MLKNIRKTRENFFSKGFSKKGKICFSGSEIDFMTLVPIIKKTKTGPL